MRTTEQLPARLRSEPLVDAIFELHFQADAAAQVLPGLVFSQLTGDRQME